MWQIIDYHVASNSVQNRDTESVIDFRGEVNLQVFIVMGVGRTLDVDLAYLHVIVYVARII